MYMEEDSLDIVHSGQIGEQILWPDELDGKVQLGLQHSMNSNHLREYIK